MNLGDWYNNYIAVPTGNWLRDNFMVPLSSEEARSRTRYWKNDNSGAVADASANNQSTIVERVLTEEEKVDEWNASYDKLINRIANCKSMDERSALACKYQEELANFRDSKLNVDNDLAFLHIGPQGQNLMPDESPVTRVLHNITTIKENMTAAGGKIKADPGGFIEDVAVDAGAAVHDFVEGAKLGFGEKVKQRMALDEIAYVDEYGIPYRNGDGQYIPKEGYTLEQVQEQVILKGKADKAFEKETFVPMAQIGSIAGGPYVAGGVAVASMAERGAEVYQNTNGTPLEKAGNVIRELTYGPVVDQLTDPNFVAKFEEHPARTAANATLASIQAVAPVAILHPAGVKGAKSVTEDISNGAKLVVETSIKAEGLEPVAVVVGGEIKGVTKDLSQNEHIIEARSYDPAPYQKVIANSSETPLVAISGMYKEQVLNKTTVSSHNTTGSPSTILAKSLEEAGIPAPGPDYQAHHIIPLGKYGAGVVEQVSEVHKTCIKFGFDLNSAANGIWMPNKKGSTMDYVSDVSIHSGKNNAASVEYVVKTINESKPQSAADIAGAVHDVRQQLLSGDLKLNKAVSQTPLIEEIGQQVIPGLVVSALALGQARNALAQEAPTESATTVLDGASVRQTMTEYSNKLAVQGRCIDNQLTAPPMTFEQAKEQGIADYTNGLNRSINRLQEEYKGDLTYYDHRNRLLGADIEQLGMKLYVPKFMLAKHHVHRVEDYENEQAKVKELHSALNNKYDELLTKIEQLKNMLNTFEADEIIKRSIEKYLKSDQERLEKRSELEERQQEIRTEQEKIKQFEQVLPYEIRNMSIEITGDASAPQNLLAQIDRITAQTAPVIQEQRQQQYSNCYSQGR